MGSLSSFDRRNHLNIVLKLYSSKNGNIFDCNLQVLRALGAIDGQDFLAGEGQISETHKRPIMNTAETLSLAKYVRDLNLQQVERDSFIFKSVLHLLLMQQESDDLFNCKNDFQRLVQQIHWPKISKSLLASSLEVLESYP